MTLARVILFLAVFCLGSLPARGAELVVFETDGCPWCEAWQKEVGSIFHLTDEAKIVTLRRVELNGPRPDDLRDIKGIRYTPTFVLLEDGGEVGRIEGFIGQDQFWGLLGELIERLRKPKPNAPASQS